VLFYIEAPSAMKGLFLFFFCLETKEAKVQGCDFLGYKSVTIAKTSELASLRTANTFAPDLLHATKPNA
jgi:hypothetical protein